MYSKSIGFILAIGAASAGRGGYGGNGNGDGGDDGKGDKEPWSGSGDWDGSGEGSGKGDGKPDKWEKPKWDWRMKFGLDLDLVTDDTVVFNVTGRRGNFLCVKGQGFNEPMYEMMEPVKPDGDDMQEYVLDFGVFQLCRGKRGLQIKYNGTESLEIIVEYKGFDGAAKCSFNTMKDIFFDWTYECEEFTILAGPERPGKPGYGGTGKGNGGKGDGYPMSESEDVNDAYFCTSDEHQDEYAIEEGDKTFEDENASFSYAISFKYFGIRIVKTCNCGYQINSFTGSHEKETGHCMYDADYYSFYWKFWRKNTCKPSPKGCKYDNPCYENSCEYECMSNEGSAFCTCPGNYTLADDDMSCVDVQTLIPEVTVSVDDFHVSKMLVEVTESGNSHIYPSGTSDYCFLKKYGGASVDQGVFAQPCSTSFKTNFDFDESTGLIKYMGAADADLCVGVKRLNTDSKRIIQLQHCMKNGEPNPHCQWDYDASNGMLALRNRDSMCMFWKPSEILRVGKCFTYGFGVDSVAVNE